jgi:hypothetical protein
MKWADNEDENGTGNFEIRGVNGNENYASLHAIRLKVCGINGENSERRFRFVPKCDGWGHPWHWLE